MNTANFPFGFRVAGPPRADRTIVTWRKAWSAYNTGEEDSGEAYLSLFCYPQEFVDHFLGTRRVAGYTGPCCSDWIPMDIDGTGDDPVANALERACNLLGWLGGQGANLDALCCSFSGNKGFHILLPNRGLADDPGPLFRQAVRAFVARIGQESGCGPDLSIYDPVRIFRAPNTRHPVSGLFKVNIPADELLRISPDGVRRVAAEPRPGDVPEPCAWCDWNIGGLGGLWGRACDEARAVKLAPVDPSSRTELNRATLDFIRGDAVQGERELSCFKAAANLAEFGAPDKLVRALLLPAALDRGMTPTEACHAIETGVKHGRRIVG